MKRQTIIILSSAISIAAYAQNDNDPQKAQAQQWEQYITQLSDIDDIEENDLEEMYDQLSELEATPINLNTATSDDLDRLTFLNDSQKEELTEYLDRYRPLRSKGELSMIESIDPTRLQLLYRFTYISEEAKNEKFPSINYISKYGKNEVTATAKIPFYEREGDRNGYLGYKYKHWLKYNFKYGQYVQAGILGTQDAGEPFFANGNSLGYDHYSYYLIIRQLNRIKALALGQYKLRFAMGLVMNTGFCLGKTTSLTMSIPQNSITANSSRSETYYMQGAAATIKLNKRIDATTFLSYRKIDATLNDDGTIKTLLNTGYHRTLSEMQRKHDAARFTTGGNIRWRDNGWHFGTTGVFTHFSRDLKPDASQLYRRFYPTGKDFFNASVDYGFINHRININGETAINSKGAIATLNSVTVKAASTLSLTAIQRYYSYRYNSLYSASFSDGGKIQNESGVYLGAAWEALPKLTILAYTDYAYFPWVRYHVTSASHSWDNLMQMSYKISQSLTLVGRYRIKLRQEDYNPSNSEDKILINKNEQRGRILLAYTHERWAVKTQADATFTTFPQNVTDKSNSFGWMITQNVGCKIGAIEVAANVGYFHTHDYDSRLYTYERGTLYNFSFPMFYGEGMRTAVFVRGNIGNNIMVICKVGNTKYFDRDKISSSYQQINKSYQTDMDIQIRWKF